MAGISLQYSVCCLYQKQVQNKLPEKLVTNCLFCSSFCFIMSYMSQWVIENDLFPREIWRLLEPLPTTSLECHHWTQVSCPLNASQDDFHQQENVPFLLSVSVCPHKGALHFLHSDLTACVFLDQDIFQPFCCHLTPPFSRSLSFSQWHMECDKKKRKAISRCL